MTRLIVSDPKQLKPKKQEPAVPELDDKALREEMNATVMLATDAEGITDGEIVLRGFAKRVLMKWGTKEGMYLAFRDAVTAPVPKEWREAMQEAHDTFQRYADLHRAKDTRDSHEKANVNQKLANRLYALLQSAEVRHD